MPKASPFQSSFNGGEFGSLLHARIDADRYKTGLEICENYLPTVQGPLVRRPGTRYVAETKYRDKRSRLIRYKAALDQAYMLEVGHLYIRPYINGGQILETTVGSGQAAITGITNASPGVFTSGAQNLVTGQEIYLSGIVGMTILNGRNFKVTVLTPTTFTLSYLDGTPVNTSLFPAYTSGGTLQRVYEIATPWTESQVFELDYAQTAEAMYFVHPSHYPRVLFRQAHDNWWLSSPTLSDGPWLPINSSATTVSIVGAGPITFTVTSSAPLFAATDVGRLMRIYIGTWISVQISAFTNSQSVTVVKQTGTPAAGGPFSKYRFGVWSSTLGYPRAITFRDERLIFATGQRIDMSKVGEYGIYLYIGTLPIFLINFAPTDPDDTQTASHAISYTLNSEDIQVIHWMVSEEKALIAGTEDGEWVVRPSEGDYFSATVLPSAKQTTSYGSARIKPVFANKAVLFVQASKTDVREISYYYEVDGFRTNNRSILNPKILGATGARQISYQKSPSIVWWPRNDGVLAGMTFEKEEEALILGWHRAILGGVADSGGASARVESSAALPAEGGVGENNWLVVQRYRDGQQWRSIEYMEKPFDDNTEQKDGYFVDCGLTYDNPLTITAASIVSGAIQITIAGHGLVNGDRVRLYSTYFNFAEETGSDVDGEVFTVANATTNTFTLTGLDIDTLPEFQGYVTVRKLVTSITGLWHLEGTLVDIVTDGAVHPQKTVTNGAVTMDYGFAVAHIGYKYKSKAKLLRIDAGAADGTSIGKTRRTHRVGFFLYRTNHLEIGTSFDNLQELTFRREGDDDSGPVPLYSGIRSEEFEADYDFENQICFQQSKPLPGTILGIFPQMHTEDRG